MEQTLKDKLKEKYLISSTRATIKETDTYHSIIQDMTTHAESGNPCYSIFEPIHNNSKWIRRELEKEGFSITDYPGGTWVVEWNV
jgi:hypothetical protein